MSHSNSLDRSPLGNKYPVLDSTLCRESLATLPTPVKQVHIVIGNVRQDITVKCDNLTSPLYGGNKVRKLEYALTPARLKACRLIATFGTVGSHHALATAMYAAQLGYRCTCFLAHQTRTEGIAATLRAHLQIGTEIVRYGGAYAKRMQTLREHLWGRSAWVVPAGGSSWLGTMGFVNAGLELAEQVAAGEIDCPDRVYVATGTLGTAAGLGLGLAAAGLDSEVHAVRVSHTSIANEDILRQLVSKTAQMMRMRDETVPSELAARANITMRHDFFGSGYARTTAETDNAIALADSDLGLTLESTYTGKAMAALLHDVRNEGCTIGNVLFWNTYNSAMLPGEADDKASSETTALPEEFAGYLD